MAVKLIPSDDLRLRTRAMPIDRVRGGARKTFDQMIDCMDANCGVGLSAPQIGLMLRLVVMRAPRIVCMADPVIISASANFDVGEEGCLSFPGARVAVRRHARVTVRYRDYHNETRVADLYGLEAICAQHEIDHLDGVLFFTRAYQDGVLNAGEEQVRSERSERANT